MRVFRIRLWLGLPLLALLLLSTSPRAASAADKLDWPAWRKLVKAFETAVKAGGDPAPALALAGRMVTDAEPRAAKPLFAAIESAVEVEDKAHAETQRLVLGIPKRRWSKEVHVALLAARRVEREARLLAEGIADQIGAGDTVALHDQLAGRAAKSRDFRWHGLVARAYSHTPKRDAAIRWLGRQISCDERVIRARVLQALGARAKSWPRLISQRLGDGDWAIRTLAARLVRVHMNKMAIGELVGALSCTSPRVQKAFIETLVVLTGQDFGQNQLAWRFWWEEQRRRRVFGPQTSSGAGPTCQRRGYAKFYNLELHSNRMIFVVDVSASMTQMATRGTFQRIELMKRQLERTLRRLEPGVTFNLVAFGGTVRSFRPGLVVMDERIRTQARRWVERLRPEGGTYMNGAMHLVFQQMGFGDLGRGPLAADTIVLLSDGAPTDGWPGGRGLKGREVVRQALAAWNKDQLIVIHTVALGGPAKAFLKRVAEEHGGIASVR